MCLKEKFSRASMLVRQTSKARRADEIRTRHLLFPLGYYLGIAVDCYTT